MESPKKKYKVVFTKKAEKQIRKLDRPTFYLITKWIKKNLEGCENPRSKGKGLVGNHGGEWRYRVGDYRIIAEIKDSEILIYIFEVGHRKEIYE